MIPCGRRKDCHSASLHGHILPSPSSNNLQTISMAKQVKVTEYQTRVYALLQQIPEGKVTTYAAMSKALNSSPRAVGGALRNNPFAPEVPCHRCIASTGVSGAALVSLRWRSGLTITFSSLAASRVTGRRPRAGKTSRRSSSCFRKRVSSSMRKAC